jgi:3-(3-hydroxy-phenyl)propionate hydroxylase
LDTTHIDYQRLTFDYVRASEIDAPAARCCPVVVVGAGPVGLSMAIDLAQRGTPVVLLDEDNRLSSGSRAICFAKRTLEIFDRLGCGEQIAAKGVSWNTGKVFWRDDLVYSFDLLPEPDHRRPAFVNLQQYYVEGFLFERARNLANLDIRWHSQVVGVAQSDERVAATIRTPDGDYTLPCQYMVAADGGRSAVRRLLGHESKGQSFRDRFLIADVRMQADFPTERWFWFDPRFHPNRSVLLHRQPDDVWRIDFQLGWEADPEVERQPERVIPRVQALLGKDMAFEVEWVSVYTFSCLRMATFRDRRVLFAGDSAHGVSPFGARGANSGVQDADNLAWKLDLVLAGQAPEGLLDTYASEREFAADENILNSTRSTDFITPKSEMSRIFRDATLHLARDCPFARRLVNSGRLSTPSILVNSPLNTVDDAIFADTMVPGAPASDAPVRADGREGWLLEHLAGGFTLLYFGNGLAPPAEQWRAFLVLGDGAVPIATLIIEQPPVRYRVPDGLRLLKLRLLQETGLVSRRFDARPGTTYLLRPDQHVCARWRQFDVAKVLAALARATCQA